MSILNPQTGLYEFPPVNSDLIEMKDRMKEQEREQQQIRNQSDDYAIVPLDSPEYKQFIKKLEQNLEANQKLSVCLLCWGFITFYQKRRHQEHSHYIVTPTYFKTEDLFLKLARQHGKLLKGNKVAVFADQCKITQNSYVTPPTRGLAFGGSGAGTNNQQSARFGGPGGGSGLVGAGVNEIRAVSQKQIEHEQHIKRLNQIINSLCEEAKAKEKRVRYLEEQLTQMQLTLAGAQKQQYTDQDDQVKDIQKKESKQHKDKQGAGSSISKQESAQIISAKNGDSDKKVTRRTIQQEKLQEVEDQKEMEIKEKENPETEDAPMDDSTKTAKLW